MNVFHLQLEVRSNSARSYTLQAAPNGDVCLRSVAPVNHVFSHRLNRWSTGNPSSPNENTTQAAAMSADTDKLNIKTKTPGRLLIDCFS